MIEDGDFVILKKESSMRVVQAKKNGRPFVFEKTKFRLDNIIGKLYGTQFEIDNKSGQLVPREDDFCIADALPETSSGLDNRNLVSSNDENQNLGKDEIHALRKDGLTGDEVMTELIKNSATFTQKTKFSQEKWIKKKKKRHMNVYTVLRPSVRLIADMHYQRDPAKICFLRMDSLAQVLTMSNVQATSKVLLVESCQGLLAGAILDRLNDKGCLTQFFTGPNPMKGRAAFDDFGFPKQLARSRMRLYPLNRLSELSMFSRPEDMTSARVADGKRRKLSQDSKPSPSCVKSDQNASSPGTLETDSSLVDSSSPVTEVKCIPDADLPIVDPSVVDSSTNDLPVADHPVADPPGADADASTPHLEHEKRLTTNNATDTSLAATPGSNNIAKGEKRQLSEDPKKDLPPHLFERQQAKKYIEENKFDTLIIAIKAQPTQLALRLINLVKLSRPFVVFHPHKEPLMELFVQLKERGGVVNLKFSETWFRAIQVLPERTHPMVNMSGSSGYMLTGTLVDMNS